MGYQANHLEGIVNEISEMEIAEEQNVQEGGIEQAVTDGLEEAAAQLEAELDIEEQEQGEVAEQIAPEAEEAQPQQEGKMEVEEEEQPKKKQGKKKKTSKYYGVSKISKRFRAMFAGKYIGMAGKEIDAARMVNEWCKKCGVEPKNKIPGSKKSKKVKKAKTVKKVKKAKRVKKVKKASKKTKKSTKKASKVKKAKKRVVRRKK